jgi:hypothetical protein
MNETAQQTKCLTICNTIDPFGAEVTLESTNSQGEVFDIITIE